MNFLHHPARHSIEAEFRYPIYSPRGGVEGALLLADEEHLQLVFEPDGGDAGSAVFSGLRTGTRVRVEARPEPVSGAHAEPAHRVYRFERLVSVDGRAMDDAVAATPPRAPYSGIVVRLNFARHGEPNGYVLDSGDFIHTRPEGMAQLQLGVGDRVEADGEARPLAGGSGMVVEASVVNGRTLDKPKRPAHA
jgi:hypothetical protein